MDDNVDRSRFYFNLSSPLEDLGFDFCLSCDRQIESGNVYCSEACRLADKASYNYEDGNLLIEGLDEEPTPESGLAVVKPDSFQEVRHEKEAVTVSDISKLQSNSEAEGIRESRRERKIQRSWGKHIRAHHISIENDSDFSDNDPLNDPGPQSRRLRRRVARGTNIDFWGLSKLDVERGTSTQAVDGRYIDTHPEHQTSTVKHNETSQTKHAEYVERESNTLSSRSFRPDALTTAIEYHNAQEYGKREAVTENQNVRRECSICDCTFSQEGSLERHYFRIHAAFYHCGTVFEDGDAALTHWSECHRKRPALNCKKSPKKALNPSSSLSIVGDTVFKLPTYFTGLDPLGPSTLPVQPSGQYHAMSIPASSTAPADSEIEENTDLNWEADDEVIWEDDDEVIWEDNDEANFSQQANTKPELVSRRSLLTTVMHQSGGASNEQAEAIEPFTKLPVAKPLTASQLDVPTLNEKQMYFGIDLDTKGEDGKFEERITQHFSDHSTGDQAKNEESNTRGRYQHHSGIERGSIEHARVLSPRSVRRNMLQTELTEDLRRSLLREREGVPFKMSNVENYSRNLSKTRRRSESEVDLKLESMSFRDTKQNSRSSSVDLNSESVPYYDDSESVVSSYAASVISVESLASSATDLSRGSGYSTHQIATATKELVTIFQEDDFLKPLYKRAIRDDSIGPEKLQRNLRRLFKKYAEHLKDEAKDGLEYLAARLVSLKARFVAHTIVQSINSEDQPRLLPKLQVTSKDDSSADEEETQAVDETTFENLVTFREFLVGSDAFRTLKTQIQSFVLPKAAQAPPERTTGTKGKDYASFIMGNLQSAFREDTSVINFGFSIPFSHVSVQTLNTHIRNFFMPDNARNSQEKFKQRWNEFLVLTGQMEPPLEPGKIRLRWQCGCRQNFTGDFAEYKDGGIADLVSRIEQSTGTKVTITSHNSTISNQKSTGQHPGLWIRNALTRLTTTFRKPTKQCTLPQHNPTTTTCCPAPPTGSRSKMIHLLSCMHAGRFRKSLAQDRIESINTDRNLFCFLRQQFRLHRGRFSTLLSLKTVQGIYFIKFRLPMGGSVEVRHHNPCCVSPQPCECIPPAHRVEPSPRAEYRCIPGPPSVWPPIDPHYLAHLFTTPTCINENDTWILDQLPKRICGELQGKAGQPAEGWGIYYQEGWDRDVITLGVFGIFLVASLIFGVLWSCLKMDVQGAFGVSAYMVAACGVFVSLVTVKVDKV